MWWRPCHIHKVRGGYSVDPFGSCIDPDLRFAILTAVVRKSSIFWDITPCSPLKFNRRSRGTYHFHLQGGRISWARNRREIRATCFSETSVDFQRRYVLEDITPCFTFSCLIFVFSFVLYIFVSDYCFSWLSKNSLTLMKEACNCNFG
jgi:hypothetical protein